MQTREQILSLMASLEVPAPAGVVYTIGTARNYAQLSLSAVRPNHAMQVLKKPDREEVFEHDGQQMFVATKRMKLRKNFVQVVIGVQVEDEREVLAGFRLFGDKDQLEALMAPAAAFAEVLARYGVAYRPAEGVEERVLFTPLLEAKQTLGDAPNEMLYDLNEVMGVEPVKGQVSNMMVKRVDGTLRARWPFIIDTNRYRDDLAAYGR